MIIQIMIKLVMILKGMYQKGLNSFPISNLMGLLEKAFVVASAELYET